MINKPKIIRKEIFISVLFFILISICSCAIKRPVLRIGLVADPQYADLPTKNKRYYKESLLKLKEAIDTFNYYNVNLVQNLGDIIDTNFESFDSIMPVYKNLDQSIKNYHLLGNHDFSIDSTYQIKLLDILEMPNFYYSYVEQGWRFIVLDATDYSFFSKTLHKRSTNNIINYFNNTDGKSNNHNWNGAIGPEQQSWLKQELIIAKSQNQKVIIYSHLPIKPFDKPHNLWNDSEIVNIIEDYKNVVAFINGHNHTGEYIYDKGIHYITLCGMVETPINSYAILEIYRDRLILKGFGNQRSIKIDFSK